MHITITELAYLVLILVSVFLSIFNFIATRKSKNKKNTDTVSSEEVDTVEPDTTVCQSKFEIFRNIFQKVLNYATGAETVYNAITKAKCGELKLQDVLSKLKVDCISNNEVFDEAQWTDIIEQFIQSTKIINKSNQLDNNI